MAVPVSVAPPNSPAETSSPTRHASSRSVERWQRNALHPEHDPRFTEFLAPPQADDELGRLGKYRILAILGHGGMGVVFKAEDPRLGRLVALKVMLPEVAHKPEMKERFLREAKAAAAVVHDHIVRIYDVDEERGVPFLAMEFLQGASMEARLRQGRTPTVRQILKLGREIARGLAAAHNRGLIHRDIKPANIWLDASAGGRVKILDFGVARVVGEHTLTQTGAILGTPAYMAPEQARGEKVDGRADLFSLGVVLYRLCTAETPFKGKDTFSVLTALAVDTPRPPHVVNSAVSRPLSALVMHLLEKDPARRPGSADEVVRALQNLEKEFARQEEVEGVVTVPDTSERGKEVGKRTATSIPLESTVATSPAAPPVVPPPEQAIAVYSKHGRSSESATRRPAAGRNRLPLLIIGGALFAALMTVVGWVVIAMTSTRSDPGKSLPNGKVPAKLEDGKTPLLEPDKGNQAEGWPREIENSIGMTLVRIPPGTFKMGSPEGEKEREKDEQQHEVEITKDFWLGIHEVTQKQFKAVMGYNPSFFSKDGEGKPGLDYRHAKPAGGMNKVPADTSNFPVENVSWEEADEFCKKLTAREAEKQNGRKYRLPSDAEWEYCCRGGAPSYQVFHFGNSLSSSQANFDGNYPYGGADKGRYLGRTCKVGSYAKNRFGLYDMHGNVYEWCNDWYGAGYYATSPREDPPGPPGGTDRVFRGGGWDYGGGRSCRSANRDWRKPAVRSFGVGFRVALVPSRR
jgi:formylglycine-generating enzyme required for sulfatase activity